MTTRLSISVALIGKPKHRAEAAWIVIAEQRAVVEDDVDVIVRLEIGGNRSAQPRVVDDDPFDAPADHVRRDSAPGRLDFRKFGHSQEASRQRDRLQAERAALVGRQGRL